MVSTFAVAIAAALQMVLGISFFIEQSSDLCSTAPTLASWLFLIALLDILLDVGIFPIRYMHLPYVCQLIAETILTVLLTEFGTMVVWCTIERISCKLCRYMVLMAGLPPNIYYVWERYILGTVTTSISLVFLFCAGHATDHFYVIRKKSLRMYRELGNYTLQIWQKFRKITWPKQEYGNNGSTSLSYECRLPEDDETVAYEELYRPKKSPKRSRSRSRSSRKYR